MADERNTENFALGVIVAAIIFLLLRREFGKRTAEQPGETRPAVSACGCGAGKQQANAQNPEISLGHESYNILPFTKSSVTPNMANSPTPGKQWVTHA